MADLSKIVEVWETDSALEANRLLGLGWRLISIPKTIEKQCRRSDSEGYHISKEGETIFVLGRTKEVPDGT